MKRRRRWGRYHARVESLDVRDLPSTIPIVMSLGAAWGRNKGLPALRSTATATNPSGSTPAAATPTGVPTPHELARERFTAKLTGTYAVGPGRFTDQARQGFLLASGGSNQSLHMSTQTRIFVPNVISTTTPVTGIASLFAKDVANSGNALVLDLTADSPPGPQGLPTHYTWTVDPSSGGLWQNSGGFGTGSGTLELRFIPGGKVPGRATGAGKVNFFFQGLINTSQVSNDLASPGNRPG